MQPPNPSDILDRFARGELSVDQAVSALNHPKAPARRHSEREWLPLWLRIVIANRGDKGIRLRIPLFLVLPLALGILLLLFPILLIALFVLTLTFRRRIAPPILGLVLRIFVAMGQLFLCGRGAGVEVMDGKDEVILRLE
ncbi:MAG: hypothetical protein V1800_18395 [Candidatus Latescibacterota bacterium]